MPPNCTCLTVSKIKTPSVEGVLVIDLYYERNSAYDILATVITQDPEKVESPDSSILPDLVCPQYRSGLQSNDRLI